MPRCPSMWPQRTPNQNVTTSTSGTTAHSAAASATRVRAPATGEKAEIARPKTAWEKTVAMVAYGRTMR
jgi:hypothetical protein